MSDNFFRSLLVLFVVIALTVIACNMPESQIARPENACMGKSFSCSACCGIYNLAMTPAQRQLWLKENTARFLELDLSTSANIVRFRHEREAATLPRRVREDTYVCPFVGFVDADHLLPGSLDERPRVAREPGASLRTGCLLHPQGSPHPQIALHAHPQNFSFYGEGICQAYDCLAKEQAVQRTDFFRWAETAGPVSYGQLASDHTLHRSLALCLPQQADLAEFYALLARAYERYGVVITSFEDIEKWVPDTAANLCSFLAERVAERRGSQNRSLDQSRGRFARRLAALLLRRLPAD